MPATRKTSYFNRPDTMLGVCQAIGDDMGISANWLRIGFAVAFFFFPLQASLAYLGLVAFAAMLRRVWPDEIADAATVATAPAVLKNRADDLPMAA